MLAKRCNFKGYIKKLDNRVQAKSVKSILSL